MKQDNQISSILSPEVEIQGDVKVAGSILIYGKIYGKLVFSNKDEENRALEMGITNLNTIYQTNDLANGEVMFAATGVTDGTLLKGVLFKNDIAKTHSVVMRSKTKTQRYVSASHDLKIKNIIK